MNACDPIAYAYEGALFCAVHGELLEALITARCTEAADGSAASDVIGPMFVDGDAAPLEWCDGDGGHSFCGSCGTGQEGHVTRFHACRECRTCFGCGEVGPFCVCRPDGDGLAVMVGAYVACALWSSSDILNDEAVECGETLDAWASDEDVAPETLAEMEDDVLAFWRAEKADLVNGQFVDVGHDFWLSRNGHGAGFFDGAWGGVGDRLRAAARVYGVVDLYVGDDGLVHA